MVAIMLVWILSQVFTLGVCIALLVYLRRVNNEKFGTRLDKAIQAGMKSYQIKEGIAE